MSEVILTGEETSSTNSDPSRIPGRNSLVPQQFGWFGWLVLLFCFVFYFAYSVCSLGIGESGDGSWPPKKKFQNACTAGHGGTCLQSQHLEGRVRWISEFKASLVYRVTSRTAGLHRETLTPKTKKQKTKNSKNKKQNKQTNKTTCTCHKSEGEN